MNSNSEAKPIIPVRSSLPLLAARYSEHPKPKPPNPQPIQVPKKRPEPDVILWAKAHQKKTSVHIDLHGGGSIVGIVECFGLYSVTLNTPDGDVVVFKHAMVTARGV